MPKEGEKGGQNSRPPGQMRQYLMNNFTFPEDGDKPTVCQNGHVLNIFFENNRSYLITIQTVNEKFGFLPHRASLLKLLRKAEFVGRKYYREKERQKFVSICQEKFVLYTPATRRKAEPKLDRCISEASPSSMIETMPSASAGPGPSTSGELPLFLKKLRASEATLREQKLRQRLSFVSKSCKDMKASHLKKIKELKGKIISDPLRFKRLNQKVKRKDAVIRKLKLALADSGLKKENTYLKKQLKKLKKKNRMSSIRLDEKNEEIRSLRNKILLLLQKEQPVQKDQSSQPEQQEG